MIEGLERECIWAKEWGETNFPTLAVIKIGLVASIEVVEKRWAERGWGEKLPERVRDSLKWYQRNAKMFHHIIDTSEGIPEECAKQILAEVGSYD